MAAAASGVMRPRTIKRPEKKWRCIFASREMDMASGDNLQGDSAKLHDWGKWNEVNDATGVAGKLSSRELYGLTTMRT